jgi:hypothetical protein
LVLKIILWIAIIAVPDLVNWPELSFGFSVVGARLMDKAGGLTA